MYNYKYRALLSGRLKNVPFALCRRRRRRFAEGGGLWSRENYISHTLTLRDREDDSIYLYMPRERAASGAQELMHDDDTQRARCTPDAP